MYEKPAPLNAIELLPGALADAWSDESEPKTTVAGLYAALKKAKGKPWPPNAFMNTVKEALGRGTIQRADGGGVLVSLAVDGAVKLILKSVEKEPLPAPGGRVSSKKVSLTTGELQNLNDEAAALTKALAGCDVQFEVAVSIQPKAGVSVGEANKLLEKVKKGWTLA